MRHLEAKLSPTAKLALETTNDEPVPKNPSPFEYIRKLSDRGLHPTPRILGNLVLELVRKSVGARWIERFQKRYENELASVYLPNIDQSRHSLSWIILSIASITLHSYGLSTPISSIIYASTAVTQAKDDDVKWCLRESGCGGGAMRVRI